MSARQHGGADLWNILGAGLAVVGLALGILQPGIVVGWLLLVAGMATLGLGAWVALGHRRHRSAPMADGSIIAGRSITAGHHISAAGRIQAGDTIHAGGNISAGPMTDEASVDVR